MREILRSAVKDGAARRTPLGSRLRARFAGIGLEGELPELRAATHSREIFGHDWPIARNLTAMG